MLSILLALAAFQETETWEYRATLKTFVNTKTLEERSPADLFDLGEKRFRNGEYGPAIQVFAAMADGLPEEFVGVREKAAFAVGRCYFAAGDYLSAHKAFESFLSRAPDSDLAGGLSGGRWFLFLSALQLARVGVRERVLGVAVYKSSKTGEELLKQALARYPREPFSDDFYLALGDFYLEKGRNDDAQKEYEFILTTGQYDRSNSAPPAQLRLASIFVKRFDSVNYDVKTLADAKREYEKFISSWTPAKGDGRRLAELELTDDDLGKMLDEAAAGVLAINEKLAEKEWTMAGYYLWKGKPNAARVYLRAIVTNYPKTDWAKKAKEKLESLDK